MAVSSNRETVRFGLFEIDLKASQLTRNGTNVRLPQQPLRLLSVLIESPGEIVTREELRQRLWPSDIFIDFDHGLNKTVQKLRDALGDSAESPRYIETIPRVGYRFIAPVKNGSRVPELGENHIPSAVSSMEASLPAVVSSLETRENGPSGEEDAPQLKSIFYPNKVRLIAVAAILAAICLLAVALVSNTGKWRGRSFGRTPAAGIETIAVLPLDNLSGDPGEEYFVDGMTDELITMLAKNSTLRVVSRTSVMQYKGAHRPIRDIARELGVNGILEGSVARSGNQVHMTIQLIQAPADTHLWAESYDRNANDAVSLPMEASIAIAKRLNSTVPQSATPRYVSPEAHDAYLRGRYIWFTGSNDEAGSNFKKATELQPDYALGWSGLANYYGAGAVDGDLDPREALPAEEAAALKAVALDDSLADGHLSMSAAFYFDRWDWPRAEAEVNRAIELDPKFAEAYHLRAKIFAALSRQQEAIAAQKKAMELDPLERPWALALAFDEARQYDTAIADLRRWGENLGSEWLLVDIYRRKGALKEAAQQWEKASLLSGDKESAESIRRAFEKGGYRAVIQWRLGELKKKSAKHYVSPVDLALQYAQLGQREETLSLLEQGYREHSPLLLEVQNDPAFDFLHSDERYRSIIRRMGLPPAY